MSDNLATAKALWDEYKNNYGSPWFDAKKYLAKVRRFARTISRECASQEQAFTVMYLDNISIRTQSEIKFK